MAENHATATDEPVPYSTGDSKITDATIAEMREIAARYPQARSALLPMLHLVQSVEGRVTPEGIEACADLLELTARRGERRSRPSTRCTSAARSATTTSGSAPTRCAR